MTPLLCHPATPGDAVRRVAARAERTADGLLRLAFTLEGTLARLVLPAPAAVRVAHDLWRHTCFEAFVAAENAAAYHELNLAPSGAWGAFAFHAYRAGGPLADPALAPRIAVRTAGDTLTLDAAVRLERLSPAYRGAVLRLGLAAVVEEVGGACSYWALHHPPGPPDFHHGDAFRVRLEPPGTAC